MAVTVPADDISVMVLSGANSAALARAVNALENPNLAARIADYAGAPVNRVIRMLPPAASAGLSRAVEAAIHRCLRTAIRSLGDPAGRTAGRPNKWRTSMIAGVTGGVSGFLGAAALPIELPLTTTFMLRAIADVARRNGEDLRRLDSRLACIEVFALGGRSRTRADVGYFAARAMLTRMTGGAAAVMAERGVAEIAGSAAGSFVSAVISRFSLVVSDRVAASAIPVVGAVGGATINVIFMNHFQSIAEGHFTVRRLEREYGAEFVRRHYREIAARRFAPAPERERAS